MQEHAQHACRSKHSTSFAHLWASDNESCFEVQTTLITDVEHRSTMKNAKMPKLDSSFASCDRCKDDMHSLHHLITNWWEFTHSTPFNERMPPHLSWTAHTAIQKPPSWHSQRRPVANDSHLWTGTLFACCITHLGRMGTTRVPHRCFPRLSSLPCPPPLQASKGSTGTRQFKEVLFLATIPGDGDSGLNNMSPHDHSLSDPPCEAP